MELKDIRLQLQQIGDADLLELLNEISDEVKRRNNIMRGILGNQGPEVRKETFQDGIKAILEAMARKPDT